MTRHTRRALTRREIEGETRSMGAAKAGEPGNEITGPDFGDVAPPSVPDWLYPAPKVTT